MSEKEKPEMLITKEVLGMLRISRATLYNWIGDGKIKPVKIGHKLLFRRSDVEKLLNPDSRVD